MKTGEQISVEAIKSRRKESYRDARDQFQQYQQTRGIRDYNKELPEYQGKVVSEVIAERARKGPIDVLDVGAGAAVFLGELKRDWPSLRAYAVSARDVRHSPRLQKEFPSYLQTYIDEVDYRTGDVQKLSALFPNEKFDVIVSVMVLVHLGDPMNEIRQIFRMLKPGGVALINYSVFFTTKQEDIDLIEYWKRFGIEAILDSEMVIKGNERHPKQLVLAKTVDVKLPMPFSLNPLTGVWVLDRNKMIAKEK